MDPIGGLGRSPDPAFRPQRAEASSDRPVERPTEQANVRKEQGTTRRVLKHVTTILERGAFRFLASRIGQRAAEPRVEPERPALPPLVRRAVELSGAAPSDELGRLLQILAASRPGATLGQVGTRTGVALAWIASGASPDSRVVSIEADPARARGAASVFADQSGVEILAGDWPALLEHAPFGLLHVDAPAALDPLVEALAPGGLIVVEGEADRSSWLGRSDLAATAIEFRTGVSALVGARLPEV